MAVSCSRGMLLNNAASWDTGQLLCSDWHGHGMGRRADLPSFADLQRGRHGRLLRTQGCRPHCARVSNQPCSSGLAKEGGQLGSFAVVAEGLPQRMQSISALDTRGRVCILSLKLPNLPPSPGFNLNTFPIFHTYYYFTTSHIYLVFFKILFLIYFY